MRVDGEIAVPYAPPRWDYHAVISREPARVAGGVFSAGRLPGLVRMDGEPGRVPALPGGRARRLVITA